HRPRSADRRHGPVTIKRTNKMTVENATSAASRPASRPVPMRIRVGRGADLVASRSEEHTSELQSLRHLVCRLLLEKKKKRAVLKWSQKINNLRSTTIYLLYLADITVYIHVGMFYFN